MSPVEPVRSGPRRAVPRPAAALAQGRCPPRLGAARPRIAPPLLLLRPQPLPAPGTTELCEGPRSSRSHVQHQAARRHRPRSCGCSRRAQGWAAAGGMQCVHRRTCTAPLTCPDTAKSPLQVPSWGLPKPQPGAHGWLWQWLWGSWLPTVGPWAQPQTSSMYSSVLPTLVSLFACLFAALLKVRTGRRLLGAPCRAEVVALAPSRALPWVLALPLPSAAPGSLPLTDFHHGSASGVAAGCAAMLGSGRRAGHSATTDGPGRLSLELSLVRWCPVGQQVKGWRKQGLGGLGGAGIVCRKGLSRAPHTCDKSGCSRGVGCPPMPRVSRTPIVRSVCRDHGKLVG